jgi:hypothetical protein
MASSTTRKWGVVALIAVLVLVAGGIVSFWMAVGIIKGKIVEALGPESEVKGLGGALQGLFGGQKKK